MKLGDGFDMKEKEIKEVGSVNPIADFKAMVNDKKVDRVGEAIKQMQQKIEHFVKGSLNGDLYSQAIECLQLLRDTCVSEDEG